MAVNPLCKKIHQHPLADFLFNPLSPLFGKLLWLFRMSNHPLGVGDEQVGNSGCDVLPAL
jgi:hypothetical protein